MERNPSERIKEIVGSLVDEPEMEDPVAVRRRRRPWSVGTKVLALGVLLLVVGLAAAAFLMQQTLTPPAGTPNPLTPNCTAPAGSAAFVGSNGAQSFECPAAAPAFTVNTAGSHTPSFVLAALYSGLFIFPSTSTLGANCTVTTGAIHLTSATAVALALVSYNYCADFTNYPASAPSAFTVSWS